MPRNDIKITGLSELQKELNKLPAKIEANVMRGAIRAGLKPMLQEARRRVPIGVPSKYNAKRYKLYPGALRDSLRISTRSRRGKITGKLSAGGRVKKTGANVFYEIMIERGTVRHSVSPGGRGPATHPGVSAKPYMRPTFDGQTEQSIKAAAEYVRKRLATKHGINRPDLSFITEDE